MKKQALLHQKGFLGHLLLLPQQSLIHLSQSDPPTKWRYDQLGRHVEGRDLDDSRSLTEGNLFVLMGSVEKREDLEVVMVRGQKDLKKYFQEETGRA